MWQGVGVMQGGLCTRWISCEVGYTRWVSHEVGLMQGGSHMR